MAVIFETVRTEAKSRGSRPETIYKDIFLHEAMEIEK